MQNLSKVLISNNDFNEIQIKKVFEKEGIVILKDFFEYEKISNISDEIFSLINKIKDNISNKIPASGYKVIYSTKTSLSYKDKISSDISIVEFRDNEDFGMIDIFNFDKSFETGKIFKEKFLGKQFQSKIEKILLKQIVIENFNIYYNKGVTATRGYHIDSFTDNRYKVFIYLTNCEDFKSGPFSYVLGSHKKNYYKTINKIYNKIFRKKSTDMKFYDTSQATPILGKIGTLFISNQTGMHRGFPQSDGVDRLVGVLNFKIK